MIMSEIKKNIETCRGEDVLAEVSAAPQDPHFGSLVNEAFDPMQQQALHQAGYDGYSEVIAQHKPYSFASAIIQMKSNLLLFLRALWQYPFGSGTLRSLSDDASLRSLADMWQHYITRLQGNETYGIPSRLSSLTDLPSAPLLLADRKISGADVADGMTIGQLMCSKTSSITKIKDTYAWDLCYRDQLFNLCSALPGLEDLYLRCKRLTGYSYSANLEWIPSQITKVNGSSEVFELPDLERFEGQSYIGCPTKNQNFKIWRLPKMVYSRAAFGNSCSWVEEIYAPSSEEIGGYAGSGGLRNYTALKKIVLGPIKTLGDHTAESFTESPNLIHLEICGNGGYLENSFNFAGWNPTNALDAILDTLVTDEDCHNNLEQFLKNFRTYIAERLADNGSGKTLTLSQAVRNAIHAAEATYGIENIIITQKGWTISPAPN
jgi:hypothetical protein